MTTLPERPPGANDAPTPTSTEEEPTSKPPPWEPSNPSRWSDLNLNDPDPSGGMPKGARIPDALAWALVCPGAADPVEGIVDGVRVELSALAELLGACPVADAVRMLERRLGTAMQLLRWTDNRERMPWEYDAEEEPSHDAPAEARPEPTEEAP